MFELGDSWATVRFNFTMTSPEQLIVACKSGFRTTKVLAPGFEPKSKYDYFEGYMDALRDNGLVGRGEKTGRTKQVARPRNPRPNHSGADIREGDSP